MADEDEEQEIDDKVTALVKTRFGGDYRAAFAHYDADGNGTIDNGRAEGAVEGRRDRERADPVGVGQGDHGRGGHQRRREHLVGGVRGRVQERASGTS